MLNLHYWSAENPYWLREVQRQGRWSLNVWYGILGERIPKSLNGNIFLDFLANQLPLLLEDVPLETRQTLFLQLDGSPAHFAVNAREHINAVFQQQSIGRGSLFPWPPITRLHLPGFLFMGAVKGHRVSDSTYDQRRYEKPDS